MDTSALKDLTPEQELELNTLIKNAKKAIAPEATKGHIIDDRIYNSKDYDRNLVIDERTQLVAKQVMAFLRKTNVYDKTIIFCVDIEHATRNPL